MKKKLILLALAAIALILTFKYLPKDCDCEVGNRIAIGDTEIAVDIADTPEERVQGLSGRRGLEDGEGLLFVFDEPFIPSFWMKDMNFPIDIIWIGESLRVIGIERGVGPETYPTTFYPPSEVKYVLEVPAGFSSDQNINVGDVVSIGQ